MPIISLIPFIGLLLSIAIIPLLAPLFWHRNFGKISAFWSLLFIFPFLYHYGISEALYHLLHVLLLEYIPFIILLLSLYTISGGIRLKGYLAGTPLINTLLIMIGTVLSSWMGTTGSAMLFIRPLLRANKRRKFKVHIIIFFIFLVANIGGSLTPMGDPPLFLGFLNGVSFFWTTKILFLPMLFVSIILLMIFYMIDSYYYKKEEFQFEYSINNNNPLILEGKINFILLLGVMLFVLLSGLWNSNYCFTLMKVHLDLQNIVRDVSLVVLAFISWKFTKPHIRNKNGFTWFPIQEVSKLFIGIFLTIIPAIAILNAGEHGALKDILLMVQDDDGNNLNSAYFWITGVLSSFLDNAPTYLVFFNLAGTSTPEGMEIAKYLMYEIPTTLLAISLGAVFMGAMTYIGNAPNFMVKSIAEENKVRMPSFFGYILWSFIILVPIFMLVNIIFI